MRIFSDKYRIAKEMADFYSSLRNMTMASDFLKNKAEKNESKRI